MTFFSSSMELGRPLMAPPGVTLRIRSLWESAMNRLLAASTAIPDGL